MTILVDKCNQSFIFLGVPAGIDASETLALLKGPDSDLPHASEGSFG
jgi:hypothetical protein